MGNKPYRVQWSDLNDHTNWAISADTQADYQDIQDLGDVTGLVGGEYATILDGKRYCARHLHWRSAYLSV
jgi:hypothetical protein